LKPRVLNLSHLFLLPLLSILILSGCDKNGTESPHPKSWQVFLGEYESAINDYLSLVLTDTNMTDPGKINMLLLTITNMQSMAPKIAETLTEKELQDFLLRYGKISTRLSESAKSP